MEGDLGDPREEKRRVEPSGATRRDEMTSLHPTNSGSIIYDSDHPIIITSSSTSFPSSSLSARTLPSIVLSDFDFDQRQLDRCRRPITTSQPYHFRRKDLTYRSLTAASLVPASTLPLTSSVPGSSQHFRYYNHSLRSRSTPSKPRSVVPLTEGNVLRLRSLTEDRENDSHNDKMTTFAQPPGSPPGLSSSKSSKSSSFRSSTFSTHDGGVLADLSHFEEIGLDDEHPSAAAYGSAPADSKSSPRQSSVATASARAISPALPPTRELVDSMPKPAFPSPQVSSKPFAKNGSKSALNLPLGVRRPPTSSTSLSSAARGHRGASRSPSPTHRNRSPASPRSVPGSSPAMRPGISPLAGGPASRRGSSTRPRRSVQEIEADCRDSEDDELPDDASLWNVPLSPGLYRTASAAGSVNPSTNNSPDRPHYLGTPSLPRDGLPSPRTAPVPARTFSPVIDSTPASPISPRMPGRPPTSASDAYAFGKVRAKSWSDVLSDLSEEALSLSQALDVHASESGTAWPRSPRRANSAFVELPPLRRNNVMIDPLPISKEKERVLSRTRPSWLPPKSQKEERKHLKEYQKMMEHSLEAGRLPR